MSEELVKLGNYTILSEEAEAFTAMNATVGNRSLHGGIQGEADAQFIFILYKLVVPIIFGLITLIGIVGNLLVIYVIFSRAKMRTVTNLLLLNLAAADLSFVVICPPFTAYAFAADEWQFGNIACKLMHYLLNVTVYVTIYTLVLISVIRYLTIVYNTQTLRFRTKKNIVIMSLIIWVIMLIGNIPILLSYGQITYDGAKDCALYDMDYGRRIYATFFTFAYLLPLIVIAIFSVCILQHINQVNSVTLDKKKKKSNDKKKQASRVLILVVVIFAVFWLPVHIHLLVAYFGTITTSPIYLAVSVLWNVLAYFNSCVNPIIYNYASKDFRDCFREVVFCHKMRTRKGASNHTMITKTTCADANNGEMKRLVTHVKDEEQGEGDCTKL